MRPPLPSVLTGGTPEMGCGSSTPSRTMRSRPGRSVTSMPPSGRNAIAHGCESPLVTTLTRILCCSAVSNTQGPAPSGGTGTPTRRLLRVADRGDADEHHSEQVAVMACLHEWLHGRRFPREKNTAFDCRP